MKYEELEKIVLSKINEKPITSTELSKIIGVKEPRIRKVINNLRRKYHPIVASKKGYYLTDNPDDIDEQIQSFLKKITTMKKVIDGLIITKKHLERIREEKELERRWQL